MTFGEKLKKLRTEKGMTQLELAKKINVSQASIYYWEAGKREPHFSAIEKLSQALDTSSLYLMGAISEDLANDFLHPTNYNNALFSIITELYGKIEIKNVSMEKKGRVFYYLIGEDEKIALSDLCFDNMVEDIEKLIKNYIEQYGTTEQKEIDEAKEILARIRREQ